MLEPIDQNFKYWMEWGEGVDLPAMLDALHSVPLVVYKLDPVSPLYDALVWIESRLQEGVTPVQYDAKIKLEKAGWLLQEKIAEIERLEGHLYSLNRLTIGKTSDQIAKQLGRLGIAFYSELGVLSWNKHHPLGRPADALDDFLNLWIKETQEPQHEAHMFDLLHNPFVTIRRDNFTDTNSIEPK